MRGRPKGAEDRSRTRKAAFFRLIVVNLRALPLTLVAVDCRLISASPRWAWGLQEEVEQRCLRPCTGGNGADSGPLPPLCTSMMRRLANAFYRAGGVPVKAVPSALCQHALYSATPKASFSQVT